MGLLLNTGTSLACSFGSASTPLKGTTATSVLICGKTACNVADVGGTVNISPFGMCSSLGNPQVQAATTAAMGVLTPQPCVPQPTSWTGASTSLIIGGKPVLDQKCTCECGFGGTITVASPGQKTVTTTG